LKPSHQKIIIGFFGLDGGFSKTLDQLSEELDLTREMVRQIKNKSLIKLKEAMINSSVRC
jgi:DNA-directed RNA polymerase sigma subunit (sigma70/sigma32)